PRHGSNKPSPSIGMFDQAVSTWYHHLATYPWRRFPRATNSERRSGDEHKRTARNIEIQHDGMELHRGCPGSVDAAMSVRVVLFSIASKRILLSTSRSHVSATMDPHSP